MKIRKFLFVLLAVLFIALPAEARFIIHDNWSLGWNNPISRYRNSLNNMRQYNRNIRSNANSEKKALEEQYQKAADEALNSTDDNTGVSKEEKQNKDNSKPTNEKQSLEDKKFSIGNEEPPKNNRGDSVRSSQSPFNNPNSLFNSSSADFERRRQQMLQDFNDKAAAITLAPSPLDAHTQNDLTSSAVGMETSPLGGGTSVGFGSQQKNTSNNKNQVTPDNRPPREAATLVLDDDSSKKVAEMQSSLNGQSEQKQSLEKKSDIHDWMTPQLAIGITLIFVSMAALYAYSR